MSIFKIVSKFLPAGDQGKSISKLTKNLDNNVKKQVLLGATGTGKTFTISNVIAHHQKPTLILAHNKTLAAQLYGEIKKLFPNNNVEYFVSNFDYYQPEAYLPSNDVYIDKVSQINKDIDLLQLSTMNSLQTFKDTIVISSVAAIYGRNNPAIYKEMTLLLRKDQKIKIREIVNFLVVRGYHRNNLSNDAKTFRVKGDILEISPGWTEEYFIRIDLFDEKINSIAHLEVLTKNKIKSFDFIRIYPAEGYITKKEIINNVIDEIKIDLSKRLKYFKKNNKLIEYQRLSERVKRDIVDLKEFGICGGIENYSRYLDKREKDDPPYTLFDYFPNDFLLIVDESHQMIPQIKGMYNGDRARKKTLVEYGFRLPSALDNRPLKFDEFLNKINKVIYVSATPGDYEIEETKGVVIEQIIRPTGLLDPIIEIKTNKNQIEKIYDQIKKTIKRGHKTLITTLTKRMAEDLADYFKEKGIKAAYLHSEIKTLERMIIINQLRANKFDVLIGINLLREGLDIPEVATIHILDADKQGFLRSTKSLIQIIGRAARNSEGRIIMYANKISDAMKEAIKETDRRRKKQKDHNEKNNITPKTIYKEIDNSLRFASTPNLSKKLDQLNKSSLTKKTQLISELRAEMKLAAKKMDFETAAKIRDLILETKS